MRTLLLALAALLWSIGTAFAAVDANTATVDELQTITGIGPTIARRIVDERRNGPFRSLDDLQARVKGIGETGARKMAAAGLTVGPGSRARGEPKPDGRAAPRSVDKAEPGRGAAKPESRP